MYHTKALLKRYNSVPDPDLEIRGSEGRTPKTVFFGPSGLSLVQK